MLNDKEIEKERAWIAKEQLRIAEKNHPVTQPADLDCEDCLGSDLFGAYEKEHKPKGM
jgi:hypothetical protein